jgi:GGDEF domain-containing protein
MNVRVGPAIASGADDVLVDGDGLDEMIDRVAARIARARTLHERATFDSVTQLRSRLFVTESLSLEIGRALRRHPSAAFAVLWLSGLAASRAERGFLAVEREVEQVAFTIAAAVRPCDTACRVADDTFVVLFPGMDADEAAALLASERGRIAGKAASVGGVTSAFVEAPRDGVTWQELFEWAERQLPEICAASVSRRQLVADVHA